VIVDLGEFVGESNATEGVHEDARRIAAQWD
jgi:hypothetical protein